MHTFQPAAGPPTGRRTAATWVAATGAFLLVAAAAAFIAGRWGELPEGAKLALVGSLTGAFLVGGRALRPSLPATGDVLFHLGAFLIPIDIAGLGVRVGWGWREHLLGQGIVLTGVLGALALGTSSPTLRRTAAVGMLVLAGGVAAVSPVPAPLVLVLAAAALSLARPGPIATSWAACSGLAPLLVGLGLTTPGAVGAGVVADLGLGGTGLLTALGAVAGAAGLAGAAVLQRNALSPIFASAAAIDILLASKWADHPLPTPWIGFGSVAILWALSSWLDQVPSHSSTVTRVALVLQVISFIDRSQSATVLAAGVASCAFALDALRRRQPEVLWGLAITVPVLVWSAGLLAGLTLAEVGLALTLAAVVGAGITAVVEDSSSHPLAGGAGVCIGLGLALSSLDPATFDVSLLVTAGIAIGASAVLHEPALGHTGGVIAITALFHRLIVIKVTDSEPYLAPVALHLLIAGILARRKAEISSWTTFAPPVALLGGAALAERWTGGPSHHALIAGVVASLAVAGGGWFRQSGPLFVGTALLIGLIAHEALAFAANLPTSVWLAVGGTALLGLGVMLERTDTSPVQAGRRLVDLVQEHFE